MSLERAKRYLAGYGRDGDVLEFETSSATVELAAQAVGCEPERIAKTLSFAVGDRVALVVCAGDTRIANPKFKTRFGCKAKMLSADETEKRIGRRWRVPLWRERRVRCLSRRVPAQVRHGLSGVRKFQQRHRVDAR